METIPTFIPTSPLKTALLFIVFNRLETTKKVFQAIQRAKPPRLYIAADGPRENRSGEYDKVQRVRNFIIENIDWECEVRTLFRDKNIGCGGAVSEAITWFFDNEDMGIILEDDCYPSQSFFWFAESALIKYKDEEKIYGITGDFRGVSYPEKTNNISLISFPLIWGWATWKRVWKHYDRSMKDWSGSINDITALANSSNETKRYFQRSFHKTAKGEINTWDYQFAFKMLQQQGYFIAPNINLISNIGFGDDSTHLVNFDPLSNALPVHEATIDISHFVENDYDEWLCKNAFNRKSFLNRALQKLRKIYLARASK